MTTSSRAIEIGVSPPDGRDSAEELRRKSALVEGLPLIQTMIDATPGMVAILNVRRQVIAANRTLVDKVQTTADRVLGMRLGEIFGCSFWRDGPDGCGTSRNCINCGALWAFQETQACGGPWLAQCDLTVDHPIKGASLYLQVKATVTSLAGEEFVVCAMEDVSSRRRLAELTRLFFHDVLNLAGGLQGHLSLLAQRITPGEVHDDAEGLCWLADLLVDVIEAQRDLMLAEEGDLEIQPQAVRTLAIIGDVRQLYAVHPVSAGRNIEVDGMWDGVLVTDVQLLTRVLGNMVKNALEATEPGGKVTIRCWEESHEVCFSVHNAGAIPEHLQSQLFKRCISTKGRSGRGMGARSMRILGENYLRGSVGFTSNDADGTTFVLRVPKVLDAIAEV
jgi:signal transduction histidine kinase